MSAPPEALDVRTIPLHWVPSDGGADNWGNNVKILRPFSREFWIRDEDVRAAVGPLPARNAIMQASYSAIALEDERRSSRLLEIDQALSRLDFDRRRIERTIKTLNEERAMLEISTRG